MDVEERSYFIQNNKRHIPAYHVLLCPNMFVDKCRANLFVQDNERHSPAHHVLLCPNLFVDKCRANATFIDNI